MLPSLGSDSSPSLRSQAAGKFLGDNDRVKLLVLYCGEEDEGLAKASAGALALLADSEEVCDKILKVRRGAPPQASSNDIRPEKKRKGQKKLTWTGT